MTVALRACSLTPPNGPAICNRHLCRWQPRARPCRRKLSLRAAEEAGRQLDAEQSSISGALRGLGKGSRLDLNQLQVRWRRAGGGRRQAAGPEQASPSPPWASADALLVAAVEIKPGWCLMPSPGRTAYFSRPPTLNTPPPHPNPPPPPPPAHPPADRPQCRHCCRELCPGS